MSKVYHIKEVEYTEVGTRTHTYHGTLEELISEVFGRTLKCGHAWEHEPGALKVNTKPKTGRSLITALEHAGNNMHSNRQLTTFYYLVDDKGNQI